MSHSGLCKMCKMLQGSALNGPAAMCLRPKAFFAKSIKNLQIKMFFLLIGTKLSVK